MPRAAHTPQVVEATRRRILDASTELLCAEGFDGFSMRKLAGRLGMTVANIYNYYPNKNAIYLDVQTRGFELLQDAFREVRGRHEEPLARLLGYARAYVDFGRRRPEHYQVMLGSNTPKYADYVDTALEPLASREKRAAVAVLDTAEATLREAIAASGRSITVPPRTLVLRLWITLHGLVSLLNNRVLAEVDDAPDAILDGMLADALRAWQLLWAGRPS